MGHKSREKRATATGIFTRRGRQTFKFSYTSSEPRDEFSGEDDGGTKAVQKLFFMFCH